MSNPSKAQQAADLHKQGFNCCQSIVLIYGPQFGLTAEQCAKVAAGFGGGIGRMGKICGALSGVILVLGMKFGATDAKDKTTKMKTYQKVALAAERFKLRCGSLECCDLLGFDLSKPEGALRAQEPGAFDKCADFVNDAAEILEELLSQE
ncbi:MAG: C_GCAxxG_C_C family protein [Phycisphaerae bacterium]|nr:C_GCAxxG_C_C family protein [Phycisphaerae bacterium]